MIPQKDGLGKTRRIPKPLTCHLDYLRVVCIIDNCSLDELLRYCDSKYIGKIIGKPWTLRGSQVTYENKITSPLGIKGGFTEKLDIGLTEVMLEFSGQYFAGISVINQWRFLVGLKNTFNARGTRVDISIDAYKYDLIPLNEMLKACDEKNNFGFNFQKSISSGTCGEDKKNTEYFGSRNSGKMVRIYEHKGECLRFETEFKRNYADVVFSFLAGINRKFIGSEMEEKLCMDAIDNNVEKKVNKNFEVNVQKIWEDLHGCEQRFETLIQKVMGSLAVSAIDFRDKSSRKDRSKASYKDTKRLDFYQKFMDIVGQEIKIKLPTKRKTIDKTIAWMQRQVSKTLSLIRDGLGIEAFYSWLKLLCSQGRYKQDVGDLKIISLIKDNPQVCSLS